jgi:hypothetical protein
MIPHHIYYQLVIVGLLWLCVMLHYVWLRAYPNRPDRLYVIYAQAKCKNPR